MSQISIDSLNRAEPLLPSQRVKPEKVGLEEAMVAAGRSEWTLAAFARGMQRSGMVPDPEWQGVYANPTLKQDLLEGLAPEYWEGMADTVSLNDALVRRDQLLKLQKSRTDLASLGWEGTALQIGASILDPTNIALGAATGSAAWGTRATRLGRIVNAGLLNAAATAPVEAYIALDDPTRGWTDVALASGSAFALGAGLHAAVGESWYPALRRLQGDAQAQELAEAAGAPSIVAMAKGDLSDTGTRSFKDAIDPQVTQGISDRLVSQTDLDVDSPGLAERLRSDPSGTTRRFESPGAGDSRIGEGEVLAPKAGDSGGDGAKAGTDDGGGDVELPQKRATDFHLTNLSSAKAAEMKLFGIPTRFDMAKSLGVEDGSETMRLAGNAMLQDPLLKNIKGSYVAANDSASAWTHRTVASSLTQFQPEYEAIKRGWLGKQRGGSSVSNTDSFNRAVGEAVSQLGDEGSQAKFAPEIQKAAQLVAKMHEDHLGLMQRHGVAGAAEVDPKANYLTRVWSQPAVNDFVGKVGIDQARKFFANSFRGFGSEVMDPELANKMAKGFLDTIRNLDEATDIEKARFLGGDPAAIGAVLRRESPGIGDAEVEQIIKRLIPKSEDAGKPSIFKGRTLLDENYVEGLDTLDGSTQTFSMANLMERDAEKLTRRYIDQSVRLSAERTVLDAVGQKTGKEFKTWDDLARQIKSEMKDAGVPETRIATQLERLETGWRLVRGMPVGNMNPNVAQTLRIVRDANYLLKSGGFGIVQVTELGNVMAEAGMGNFLKSMPVFGRWFRNATTGKMDDELTATLEKVWGVGVDRITHKYISRIEDGLTDFESRAQGIRRGLSKANDIANHVNGMYYIDSGSRRLAVLGAVNRLADEMQKGTMSAKRLMGLGLTQAQAERLFAELPNALTFEQGFWGRQVSNIDIDKLTPEVGAQFITAVDRTSSRWIQRNDIGGMMAWMHHDWAKPILQFRNFAINAYTSQTLHKIQMADRPALIGALYTSILGSMVYAGKQYVDSLGRDDAEKFRKERLSYKAIAANGWARSGWSSIIPGAADNINSALRIWDEPLFKYGRASGLDTKGLLQNPTTATIDAALRAVGAVSMEAQDQMGMRQHKWTQAQGRALSQLIPFQNVIGIKNLIDHYTTSLPER